MSEANVSIDLNNAAFLLSSTCGDDDDVIGPTQFSQTTSPLRVNVDRSIVSRKPIVDNSKENQVKMQQLPAQTYPSAKTTMRGCETVRNATGIRKNLFDKPESIDDDDNHELNESKTSERLLYDNWMCKKPTTAASAIDANKSMIKKKNRLSLSENQCNVPKLRQATINFQKSNVSQSISLQMNLIIN